MSVCDAGVALCAVLLLSAPAHCKTAEIEIASVIKIMMMAANCAKLFPNSFIFPSLR